MNSIIAEIYKSAVPEVGTPATFLSFSDRNPGVVVKIINAKTIEIATVETTVVPNAASADGSYQYGDYIQYEFHPDLERGGAIYTLRKDGNWQLKGCAYNGGHGMGKVMLGAFDQYRDPSF